MNPPQIIDFTLPEWVFLDGTSHTGNGLAGRTVIQHIRTHTIIEAVCLDEFDVTHFDGLQLRFKHMGLNDVEENHLLGLHFSRLEDEDEIMEVLEKARDWYIDYMNWEDINIISNLLDEFDDDE